MVIPRRFHDAMVREARESFPNEACGLLVGKSGTVVAFYPITNVDSSPVQYRLDPQQQLRAMLEIDDRDWELSAIFHSHTRTRAYPSQTDITLAFYPDTLYMILSLAHDQNPDLRAYRIVDGVVSEESIEIVD
ncbi:MAG: M67 family metallopeptidase [Chloroflexota bacterium]|nr:M67 family metallopeptidase [Chloroflexota bacterium]